MEIFKYFLITLLVFIIATGLIHQPIAQASDNIETTEDKIASLEQQLAELRTEIEYLKTIIGHENAPLSKEDEPEEDSKTDSRAWLSPPMGWEADYADDQIYALSSSGGVNDVNVAIGTDDPLSPFHLVGDFYNQGFAGTKNNYDPGVTSWSNVASIDITTHGVGENNSIVLLYAHVQDYTDASYVDMFVRVIRDGSTVVAMGNGAGFVDMLYGIYNGYMGATIVTYDEPSAGTHTYTLQIENVLAPARGWNFFAIELKR